MVTGKKDIAGFLSVILLLFYSMSFPHCEYSVIGFVIVLLILMTNRYGVRFRAEKWMLMVVLFPLHILRLNHILGILSQDKYGHSFHIEQHLIGEYPLLAF
jgi:vacuolar-type H+-ATPase subunit I/STV1